MALKKTTLGRLIQSFSQSEKREFKKLHSPTAEFIIIFNFFNKKPDGTTSELKAYLCAENKNVDAHKKYTSGYISVLKKYLKDKLIESLRHQAISKRPAYQILIRSINSDILREKGLYDLAQEELNMAKKNQKGAIFPLEELLLLRKDSILSFYKNYEGYSFEDIIELVEKRKYFAEEIKVEANLAKMLTIINISAVFGENIDKYLIKFQKELNDSPPEKNASFVNIYLQYWVKGLLAERINASADVVKNFALATKIWLEHPYYIEIHPRMYFGMCQTYLNALQKYSKPSSTAFDIEKLGFLDKKLSTFNLGKDELHNFQQIIFQFKLWKLIGEQNYSEVINEIPKLKILLKHEQIILDYGKIVFYYYISLALAKEKQYNESLDWLESFFVFKDLKVEKNRDYHFKVLLIYFINHLALKNNQFIEYGLKNQLKLLKKLGKWNSLTQFFGKRFQKLNKLLIDKKKGKEKIRLILNEIENKENELNRKNNGTMDFSLAEWIELIIKSEYK